ncbi:hypothetical protein SISSUDRAFT_1067314 [Sistotremastrum suecicum HHB10207 ss-3]|uniref:Uncharacterized protein n=1 Tax=Sistotremastrum suecicum HHB10207 ss-3 TaxID=1314776 RepID=A0A165X9A8_9AGAM|nr:hypothetical protein SISSUDRAFT_1067314 [Sistotremastrum suecicum HHB10207 ss-3]
MQSAARRTGDINSWVPLSGVSDGIADDEDDWLDYVAGAGDNIVTKAPLAGGRSSLPSVTDIRRYGAMTESRSTGTLMIVYLLADPLSFVWWTTTV